jgi:hypothetical protein
VASATNPPPAGTLARCSSLFSTVDLCSPSEAAQLLRRSVPSLPAHQRTSSNQRGRQSSRNAPGWRAWEERTNNRLRLPHTRISSDPRKKKQLKLKPSSADVYLPTYLTVQPGKQTECLVSSSKLTDKHSPPPTLNYSRNTLLPTHYIHKPSQWQELPKTSRLCSSMRGKNPRSFPLLHFPTPLHSFFSFTLANKNAMPVKNPTQQPMVSLFFASSFPYILDTMEFCIELWD